MKFHYPLLSVICLFSLMTLPVQAVDIQHVAPPVAPAPDKEMKHDMGGMGMHGMMAGMSDEEKEKHMRSMQEHMLKMHDLSNRILAEPDSAKKEALKTEQIQLMKAHHADMMSRHQMMQEMPK